MTQFPNPMSRSTPEDQRLAREAEAERRLRAEAAAQADELGLQNQARIEMAREDLSRRATGTTNYGQAVESPVADYLARNASQADIARQQSLARGQGESAQAHLDRLAMDPNAALNRVAMEEQTFRQTQHYAEREKAIREYLARGAQNVRDPNLQRLASEFVMSYPREYAQIRAEMRGGAAAPAQTPEERRAALAGASNVMSGIVEQDMKRMLGRDLNMEEKSFVSALQNADINNVPPENIEQLKQRLVDYGGLEVREDGSVRGVGGKGQFAASLYTRLGRIRDAGVGRQYGGLSSQDVNRARSAAERDPEGFQKFYDQADAAAAQGDTRSRDIIAADLYNQQLRRERGLDPESRSLRQQDVARSRAISTIASRHGGDPAMIDRAIKNWNSRNPDNPLLREDFGIAPAGQDVTARPGEVVEVGDIRSINPRNVSPGAILVDASGAARMARRPDGSVYGQPVLQDRNSGFHFPDPDKYSTPDLFNGAMSRQDRVNMRQAIMQSGNSMLAAEQRRLEAARRAAASGIPEIREAGLKEVNDLERELHWQYISEAASLAGPAPTGGRQEYEIAAAPGRPQRTEKPEPPVTLGDVKARLAEIMTPQMGADRDLQDRLRGMTEQERLDEVYKIIEAEKRPYGSGGTGTQSVADFTASLSGDQLAIAEARRSAMQSGGLDLSGMTEPSVGGFRPTLSGLPTETPAKSDSAAWMKLLKESYGPVLDRNVDQILLLPPEQRMPALEEVLTAMQDFGVSVDSAPPSVVELMNRAFRAAMAEVGGSL